MLDKPIVASPNVSLFLVQVLNEGIPYFEYMAWLRLNA